MSQDKRNQALQYRVNLIGSTYTLYREIFTSIFLLPYHLCFQQVNLDKANSNVSQISFFNTNVSWIQDRAIQFEGTGFFISCFMHKIINITFGYDNGRSRNTNCP